MNTPVETSNSVETLQLALQCKDEIIAALTEKLEKTANQLDQMHQGNILGNIQPAGGDDSVHQLGHLLKACDHFAPEEHFEKIEAGIDYIIEMLSAGHVSLSEDEPKQAESVEEPEQEDPTSFWENAKARLMGDSVENAGAVSEVEATLCEAKDNLSDTSTEPVLQSTEFEPYNPQPLPELPKPVEESRDPVILEEAVTDRDSFIKYLVSRLREAELRLTRPVNWEEFAEIPDEQRKRLEEYEKRLEDLLRQAELSVSLERAALTRERSKLMQVKQMLSNEIRQMGNAPVSGESDEVNQSKRWGKYFDKKS